MDIVNLMPVVFVEVENEIEDEIESETILIKDFSGFEDEIIDSIEHEKGMGTEIQHHLTGTVIDSKDNCYTVTIEVWEYPVGAISIEPSVVNIEKE